MNMAPELQVKQYVAVVQSNWCKWMVFQTGNPNYYLFCQLHNGIQTGLQLPILKSGLKKEIRSMLNRGCGNTLI